MGEQAAPDVGQALEASIDEDSFMGYLWGIFMPAGGN